LSEGIAEGRYRVTQSLAKRSRNRFLPRFVCEADPRLHLRVAGLGRISPPTLVAEGGDRLVSARLGLLEGAGVECQKATTAV
jgi:hypothetical protein